MCIIGRGIQIDGVLTLHHYIVVGTSLTLPPFRFFSWAHETAAVAVRLLLHLNVAAFSHRIRSLLRGRSGLLVDEADGTLHYPMRLLVERGDS